METQAHTHRDNNRDFKKHGIRVLGVDINSYRVNPRDFFEGNGILIDHKKQG